MSWLNKTSILASLAFANSLVAAKEPHLPTPDPERGSLAITIEATPPAKFGKMQAVQVYFVNLDRDPDPSNAESVIPSNYSDGNQVYLLNAKSGRYVAVAARLQSHMISNQEFHAFFSQEMIPQTEATVSAGRLAFMGQFSIQTSTKMGEADAVQAHYFRLILPDASQSGFMTRALSGSAPYTAHLTKTARDAQTAAAFWTEADRDSFKGEPLWQELVRREVDELKK